MKTCIRLPDYGSNMRMWAKQNGQSEIAKKACPRPWIAISRSDKKLEFVKGITDYSEANGDGTKGVFVVFFCDVGIEYLICKPIPAGGRRIFSARISQDGQIEEINRN